MQRVNAQHREAERIVVHGLASTNQLRTKWPALMAETTSIAPTTSTFESAARRAAASHTLILQRTTLVRAGLIDVCV
ncbi:MAG TPA: hypothetical protein VK157_17900 [Phycisphaerales bacterium]|nr:hypothetical protein [Phycisphaerales bacterium]